MPTGTATVRSPTWASPRRARLARPAKAEAREYVESAYRGGADDRWGRGSAVSPDELSAAALAVRSDSPASDIARDRVSSRLSHKQPLEALTVSVLRVGSKIPQVIAQPRRALLCLDALGAFYGRHSGCRPSFCGGLCATPSPDEAVVIGSSAPAPPACPKESISDVRRIARIEAKPALRRLCSAGG